MLALALLALAAAPAGRLASTPFVTVDLPAARGELYAEHFAIKLVEQGLDVTTPRDIAAVLGLERQRQLLACNEGATCLAELAGALGVDELVVGEVARVGRGYQLSVKVLSVKGARARFARSRRVDDERELFTVLDGWAREFVGAPEPRASRWWAMVPLGLGAASAGVGAGFLASAGTQWDALGLRGAAALPYADALIAKETGALHQTIGVVLLGVGVTASAAAALWFALTPPSSSTRVAVFPTLGGFVVVGEWR